MTLIPKGALVVSCQARADNPLHGPVYMAAMAMAAEAGGALALRANGPADVAAIRAVSALPLIGINKIFRDGEAVYITPSLAAADEILAAGAPIIGLDCTDRPRIGDDWRKVIAHIRAAGAEVFADCATLDEGLAAEAAGATYVSTTLSGYTEETRGRGPGPDLALIRAMAARLNVPVVAEGRFNTPELARQALDCGAHAVVVGTMITNPREITRGFVRAVNGAGGPQE